MLLVLLADLDCVSCWLTWIVYVQFKIPKKAGTAGQPLVVGDPSSSAGTATEPGGTVDAAAGNEADGTEGDAAGTQPETGGTEHAPAKSRRKKKK